MRVLCSVSFVVLLALATSASATLDPALLRGLGAEDSDEKIAAIGALVQAAPDAAAAILKAMADDRLLIADGRLLIAERGKVVDVATGTSVDPTPASAEPISINNRVRREIGAALAGLRLFAPVRELCLAAARDLAGAADADTLPSIRRTHGSTRP